MTPFPYRGATALVTGASSGIGEAFARRLAELGCRTILVARSAEKLDALATEIGGEAFAADLTRPEDVARVIDRYCDRMDLLVNNAGFGTHGRFAELDPATEGEEIALNIGAVVTLAHGVLPGMIARGRGGIVNVASTAGFQPVPFLATYSASKAFVLHFSEALDVETRGTGVRVLALCPGATETPFFRRTGDRAGVGQRRTPEQVVATGLRALDDGKAVAIDGVANRLRAISGRFAPRRMVARMAGAMVAPR